MPIVDRKRDIHAAPQSLPYQDIYEASRVTDTACLIIFSYLVAQGSCLQPIHLCSMIVSRFQARVVDMHEVGPWCCASSLHILQATAPEGQLAFQARMTSEQAELVVHYMLNERLHATSTE